MKIKWTYGFLFVALFGCQGKESSDKGSNEAVEKFCLNAELKKSTELQTIQEQAMVEQMSLPGKIEYNENDLVVFKSLLSGVVESVKFELGDYVKKGQVLANIKSVEIQSLHQQRKFQENQLVLLQKQLYTKQDLLKDGMAAQTEVLELEHQLDAAKIELDRIKETLGLYRATSQGEFQILAPKNGYIVHKAISPGQVIGSESDDLFSISNLKEVWVMVNVFASNLRFAKVGAAVKVKSLAFPDQVYTGKIDKLYPVFDANEHVMKARVVLDNPNLKLMPGLSVDVLLEKDQQGGQRAFAIPNKAILFSNNANYVVLYRDDCDLEMKQVDIRYSNEAYSYVAEKFPQGTKVVASNALLIFEELRGR